MYTLTSETGELIEMKDYESDATEFTIEHCLSPDTNYMFVLSDTWGDGICCDYEPGSFTITWDGE